jgi:hypothetical protein
MASPAPGNNIGGAILQRIVLFIVFMLISAKFALADDIVTDRPDATESSSVVEPGFYQIEVGWLYGENDVGVEVNNLPGTLVRIGIVDRLELRLGWDGYIDEGSGGPSGVGDGEVGAKIYMLEAEGNIPETALLAAISMPVGDREFTTDEVDPGFRFAMSYDLSARSAFGTNLGVEWETDASDSTLSSFIYTAALGYDVTEVVGAYIEIFGDAGLSASGDAHSVDGGFTFLLAENFQLDALAGAGINSKADDWFVGAGASWRLAN